jgi:uncharacterized protein YbjT (DUF2867 family)
MNITVFGASGGIGGHVIALAAQRGHHVRAVYRTPPDTPPPGQAKVLIVPDILDPRPSKARSALARQASPMCLHFASTWV